MFSPFRTRKTSHWPVFLSVLTALAFTACSGQPPMGPRTPSGFKVTPGNTQVALTWTANTEADMDAYIISYGLASGTLNQTMTVGAAATTATVSGLTNGTSYLFAIAARNTAGGVSRRTAGMLATPVAPPPAP